jgi:hypothetical protein
MPASRQRKRFGFIESGGLGDGDGGGAGSMIDLARERKCVNSGVYSS